jgi:hypothetical protein
MEKHPMTHARNSVIALGLAAILAASAAVPSLAATAMSNAAGLRSAAPDNVTQIRDRGRRNGPRANVYGGPTRPYLGAYGAANGYGYRGSANGYDCLGGRDSDGVPCGVGY